MTTPQILLSLLFIFLCLNQLKAQNLPFSFDAKKILVLSDADMSVTAPVDGKLNALLEVRDSLSIIEWSSNWSNIKVNTLAVSNSASNWTRTIDTNPNGNYSFIIETKEKSLGLINYQDLIDGYNIYAVDHNNPSNAKIAGVTQAGRKPYALDVSNKGDKIIVACDQKGGEIGLIEWTQNNWGKLYGFPHGLYPDDGQKITATDVCWSPNDDYIAVTLEEAGQIAFYQVGTTNDGKPFLDLWGSVVNIGALPGAGQFTSDGQFYIVPNLETSELFVIDFDPVKGLHNTVAQLKVGEQPENFAIHPSGEILVIACKNGTTYPMGDAKWNSFSKLTVVQIDKASGELTLGKSFPFSGHAPEGIAFDKDGDALAITAYSYNDLNSTDGGLEFWNLFKKDDGIELEYTGFKITLPRGAHALQLVR